MKTNETDFWGNLFNPKEREGSSFKPNTPSWMNAGDNITGQNESHDARHKGEDVDEKEIGPAEQDRY